MQHHQRNPTLYVDHQFASSVKMHSCKICTVILAGLTLVVASTPFDRSQLQTSSLRESVAALKDQKVGWAVRNNILAYLMFVNKLIPWVAHSWHVGMELSRVLIRFRLFPCFWSSLVSVQKISLMVMAKHISLGSYCSSQLFRFRPTLGH